MPFVSRIYPNLSRLVLEIFRFYEKHAQNLNTAQNNSASWDLTRLIKGENIQLLDLGIKRR